MKVKHLAGLNILVWTLLFGSLTSVAYTKYHDINRNVYEYVRDYYTLVKERCLDDQFNSSDYYTIDFEPFDKKDETIAYCQINQVGYHIAINKRYYNDMNDADRRQLLYHELSHCVIYREHVEDKENYMYPYFRPIPYSSLYNQVIKDIELQCSRK